MSFEDDIKRFAVKTQERIDDVVRYAVVLAAQGVVLKSPVGNPELWQRPAPEGYVGGRFRANWQLGVGEVDPTTTEDIDKSGSATLQKIEVTMQGEKAGKMFYITNGLPYGPRLEYDGWSSQAPAGMVRITFAELPGQVESYAASLNR